MKILKLYLLIFASFNLIVVALFKLAALSHTIFFYRGIVVIGVGAVCTTGVFLVVHFKTSRWRIESIVAATLVSASLQLAFFVTVPVTLDRSISVFLLNQINSHTGGVSKEDLTSAFVSEYVYKHDAIGRRIYEQSASRNIEVSNGKIVLSTRGRTFLRVAGVVKSLYGL